MAYELAWTTLPILCYLLLKFLSRHNGPMATLVGPDGQAAKAKFYTSGKNLVYMGYQKVRARIRLELGHLIIWENSQEKNFSRSGHQTATYTSFRIISSKN